MERALRPDRFNVQPETPASEKEFKYWLKTLENYLVELPQENLDKLKVLINHISPSIFEFISEETDYNAAIENLKKIYEKPSNIVFARHVLNVRQQQPGESLDQYLQALKSLSKDCGFEAVDANTHKEQYICQSFVAGISSSSIRQRILESNETSLTDIFKKARSLEHAQKNTEAYGTSYNSHLNAVIPNDPLNQQQNQQQQQQHNQQQQQQLQQQQQQQLQQLQQQSLQLQQSLEENHVNAVKSNRYNEKSTTGDKSNQTCGNCGKERHPPSMCPSRNAECYQCGKKGHLIQVCRSNPKNLNSNSNNSSVSASVFVPAFP